MDTLASDIVLDPPCSFASHARPLGLRNLQVSSPIARRLSEGPSEREFGHVVCQNAADHIQLSRGHCFLRLHEFHVVGYAGLKFLTNQLEVLFGDLKIVVSDGHLTARSLHVQHRTTDLGFDTTSAVAENVRCASSVLVPLTP